MPTRCVLLLLGLVPLCVPSAIRAADAPQRMTWTVDGVEREALVYIPVAAKSAATPVVFAFHGHGGTMQFAARKFGFHKLWPEAIAVYPQGLKTPGRLVDLEGKLPGWQGKAGDQGDRDLKFFDAMLASLKHDYQIDERRIYSMGHSNGGGFTYLLAAERGSVLAAIAPCAAASTLVGVKPLPVFHLAGENDKLVKYEWQTRTIEGLRKLNVCDAGQPWHDEKWCTLYPSKSGNLVVTCIHPGGHELPESAPELIVKFFKEVGAKKGN